MIYVLIGVLLVVVIVFAMALCINARRCDEAEFREFEKHFHLRALDRENKK